MRETGRAVAALAALAGFLVGVPAANLAAGGIPDHLLPRQLPDSVEQAWQALRWSFMDGTLIPWLAHTLVWCAWALGVVLILADTLRLLRAGSAALRRHLAARTPRAWITSAVASVLILLSSSNALAAPATGATAVATAEQHPEPAQPRPDAYHLPDGLRPDCPRHLVVSGDTYWSLAEHHLGDGRRYTEINALNHDRIPNFRVLRPGMLVLLPPDATNFPPPVPSGAREVVVTPGETASAIAEREYGDPTAWPRLWELNRGRPQPDGRAWRQADLLLPGWRLLVAEPAATPATPPPAPPAPAPLTPTPLPSPAPATTPPSTSPTSPAATHQPATAHGGIDIADGVFLGLGTAAAVTTAMLTIRALQRRGYRIGSRHRADLQQPVAPVVRALRIAHDRTTTDAIPDAPHRLRPGQDIALAIAATHGLGLTGSGANSAARALLVHFLSEPATTVLTTQTTAASLLGDTWSELSHPKLTIASSLDSAVKALAAQPPARTVVIADQQLAAVPASTGVLVVVLGRWPSGRTAEVDAEGVVTASDATDLLGTRLFVLPAREATDVLRLFATAADTPPPTAIHQPPAEHVAGDTATGPAFELDVLGAVRLTHNSTHGRVDLTDQITPKHRELLTLLACHPDGIRRDALNAAIWPDANPDRPYNNLHYTLSTLRKAIATTTNGRHTNLVTAGGRYRLDPDLVTTDYTRLYTAITAEHREPHIVLDLYRGNLAEDISTLWLDAPREATRRDVLDALDILARAEGDPGIRLRLLERIRSIDPYAEEVYREIMRTQAQLGQHDAVSRTITLLENSLHEIGETPSGETVALARMLQNTRPETPASA